MFGAFLNDVLILCKPIRCSRSRVVVGGWLDGLPVFHNFESGGGNLPLGIGMARRSLFGKGARTPYKLVTGTQKPFGQAARIPLQAPLGIQEPCGQAAGTAQKPILGFTSRVGHLPAPLTCSSKSRVGKLPARLTKPHLGTPKPSVQGVCTTVGLNMFKV